VDHQAAAHWARLRVGPLVHGERALRVAAARIEGTVTAAAFDQLALAALGAGDPHPLGLFLLYVFAVGVPGAADERPVPSVLPDQVADPALRALLPGGLGLRRRGLSLQRPGVAALRVPLAADE